MAEVQRLVTPVFRVSFPALFKAESMDGGPLKYGCSAIWTPSQFNDLDKKRWRAIRTAMDEVAKEKFGKIMKDLPANVKRGLRDGAEKDLEGYGPGTVFATLSTRLKPGIIDRDKTPIGPEHGNDDLVYPGMYARATVNPYAYDNKGKGIALGLMNFQRVNDGERLDSATNAAEDFDDDLDGFDSDVEDTGDFLDD